MKNLETVCSYFYNAHHIPVYVYKNRQLTACFPDQPAYCYPSTDFSDYIDVKSPVFCYTTTENLFMGYFQIKDSATEIILGPVNAIPFTDFQITQLIKRKQIPDDNKKEYSNFLCVIPSHSQCEFVDIILFLIYAITGEDVCREEFFSYQSSTIADTPRINFVNDHIDSEAANLSSLSNNAILHHIETGDADSVFNYLCNQQTPPMVDFGHTPLEKRKNLAYYSIALFSEAAFRGGMSQIECTEIAASYYKDISDSTSVEQIDFLTGRAALFFANKVATLHMPSDINSTLLGCMQYIRHNVYNHIQVSDVAEYIGYSRVHLTRLFKKELGFAPGHIILRTKLEESKILLVYTQKSLAEISSILCFANQSHFQRSFKAQYKLTPLQYRKNNPSKP